MSTTHLQQQSAHAGGQDAAAQHIRERSETRVRCAVAGGPMAIHARLSELDEEWDLERALAALSGGAVVTGLVMGMTGSRVWRLLALLSGAFSLQHAMTGTCPPSQLLRSLGLRTRAEIEHERNELHSHLQSSGRGQQPGQQSGQSQPSARDQHSGQPQHSGQGQHGSGGSGQRASGDIPALHPTGRPTPNDYVETAAGHIKPATQG